VSRRGWILLGTVLLAAAWVHRAVACGWEPSQLRMGKVRAHSPLRAADLDALELESSCFLDAGLVQEAYRLEAMGRMTPALELHREVELDALAALRYRRAERFLLHPLDVARTRLRVAGASPEDAAPFLAARRHYEEGRLEEARTALREGGPLAEEWACLAGLLALPTDPFAAEAHFARAGESVRARWLRARALRVQFERSGDRPALCRALAMLEDLSRQDDLGTLDDDLLSEIGRCQRLLGDDEGAARAYERVLGDFPCGDMRDEAQESLLYFVYPALAKAGKTDLVPSGVQGYCDALSVKGQDRYDRSPYTDVSRPWFHTALLEGPSWLKPNAAYRTAACDLRAGDGGSAARLLETVLRLDPEGRYAPLSHYLLAGCEGARGGWDLPIEWGWVYGPRVSWDNPPGSADRPPQLRGISRVEETGAVRSVLEARESRKRCWEHLRTVAEQFPASEWAPASLSALVIVAEKLGREVEAVKLAAGILRQQPPVARPAFLRWAACHMKAWVDDGRVDLADIERAGVLDRYFLETGQPIELLARCSESPFALRALVLALRDVEMDDERSRNLAPPWEWEYLVDVGPEGYSRDSDRAVEAAMRVEWERPGLIEAARRVLARFQGADAGLLGFLHVQVARARLLGGDAAGAQGDLAEALRLAPEAEWRSWAWETLARTQIALGRFDEAAHAIDSLARCGPRARVLQTVRSELGSALERAGDRVGAIRIYDGMEFPCADAWFLVAVMCTTDELVALRRACPDAGWCTRALWGRLVHEGRWQEARLLEGDAGLDDEGLAFARSLEAAWLNLERSRAEFEPAEKQAEALYQWATAWYRHGLENHGDMRDLSSVIWCLSPPERDAVQVYLERDIPLVRARALYREVADWFPETAAAPKSLYMIGLSSFEMAQSWDIERCLPELPNETARKAYLELAEKYPSSSLADDALYWAGRYTRDWNEQRRLFERVIREHPDGDVVRIVFPDGKPDLVDERTDAFRRRNEELRRKR